MFILGRGKLREPKVIRYYYKLIYIIKGRINLREGLLFNIGLISSFLASEVNLTY